MIYFLYGQDSYRAKQKLEEIISHYKKIHKSGVNLIYIDGEKDGFENLLNGFKIVSMFAEKKLFIVKNAFLTPEFQEKLLKEIKSLNDSKDIVVVYEKAPVDAKNKLLKALKKEAKCQEFKPLDAKSLRKWMGQEFEKYGAKIDTAAENLLLSSAGNDLWQLQNEINKLANFKNKKIIEKEDVELHVRSKIETDIFKTIDAIAQKNKKQALSLLHKHIENGDSPLYLLSMVGYQLRNLLIIKELMEKNKPYAAVSKLSGLHPFVVRKNYFLCQQFSFDELKKIYRKIFQIDLDIKTGKIEPELALELLVAEI